MKKILFIIILLVSTIECDVKVKDFCNNKKLKSKNLECQGNYNLSCSGILCAKDLSSCQNLIMFSNLKFYQRNVKEYLWFHNNYESFLALIKDCPQPLKYKLNPYDICLNSNYCLNKQSILKLLSKRDECKCSGKYNQRCNSGYCAKDKRACDGLKNLNDYSISKCNQKTNHYRYLNLLRF